MNARVTRVKMEELAKIWWTDIGASARPNTRGEIASDVSLVLHVYGVYIKMIVVELR